MASFWENFAEAMGWGKANHTKHLSDISEEKRQENRNRYVDSAIKEKEEGNRSLKIENARNSNDFWEKEIFGNEGPFGGDWDSDDLFETKVFDFSFSTPESAKNMDSGDDEYYNDNNRTGKLLVRVPRSRDLINGKYWDNDNFRGNLGVYGAILDDGTELTSDEFKSLYYTNPYGPWDTGITRLEILGEDTSSDDKFGIYNRYRDSAIKSKEAPYTAPTWDSNWRRFRGSWKGN